MGGLKSDIPRAGKTLRPIIVCDVWGRMPKASSCSTIVGSKAHASVGAWLDAVRCGSVQPGEKPRGARGLKMSDTPRDFPSPSTQSSPGHAWTASPEIPITPILLLVGITPHSQA